MIAIEVLLGVNDDQTYSLRVIRRIARRQGKQTRDGRAGHHLPGDRRARAAGAPARDARRQRAATRAVGSNGDRTGSTEWETDLSSQTGASQAGILLGSNDDIPAFRWADKATGKRDRLLVAGRLRRDRAPAGTGGGLLIDDGASRGNLFSGEAEAVILTVSRMDEEKRANPGYRAFLANGFNVTRTLVLFAWEVAIECVAATQQRRRDVRPRGQRGGPLSVPARGRLRRHPRPDRVTACSPT